MSITHRDGFPWSMSQKHLRVRPGYSVYLAAHIQRQREELKAYFEGRKEPRKGEGSFREFFEARNVGVSFPYKHDDNPATSFERLAETLAEFVDARVQGQGLTDGEGSS